MKKLNMRTLLVAASAFVMVACTGSSVKTFTIEKNDKGYDTEGYRLAGRKARYEYHGLLTDGISTLNYLKTQEAADAQHFANFIDGLLTHNEHGVLVKNLATKVEHNQDYTEFTFTVRKNVAWQKWDGTQYMPTIDGEVVPQFVKPSDWVTTVKQVCNAANSKVGSSNLQYLIGMFVQGADEYYWYTYLLQDYKERDLDPTEVPNSKKATDLNELIKTKSPAVWAAPSELGGYGNGENPIEADDIPNIANFRRLGVVADDANMTLTYKLITKAPYFPTLFTYSSYLPSNEYFIKNECNGFNGFGKSKDTILYNGPYLLTTSEKSKIVYSANDSYWNKDNVITIDKINYTVILDATEIEAADIREMFEKGKTDGFNLSAKDREGWTKYVLGGKNGKGTYKNPADSRVNARLLDTIGSMYGTNLVLNRDARTMKSYTDGGSSTTVLNTARALRLNDVRKAILDSYDLPYLYSIRDKYAGSEELVGQEKVYTYVPKGFVIDDNGEDYVAAHYYKEYAKQKGINIGNPDNPEEGTAAYYLQPGQVTNSNKTDEEVYEQVQRAMRAVELFNAQYPDEAITLPIRLEFFAVNSSDNTDDDAMVESWNRRLNHIADGAEITYPYFQVVPTRKVNSSNYKTVSESGDFDMTFIQWGWGADYGDPLTFLNTYVKGGDWASIFPFIADDHVPNFTTNEAGTALNAETDLLAEYSDLVALGAGKTEDFNDRFDTFAEAEYMLIEELNIYKPQVNTGQGWALSVSRSAGYFMPTSAYGLSSDRLTGMYVLNSVMSNTDRAYARQKQEEAKVAYVSEHGSIYIYED